MMRRVWAVIKGLLRELADESAYERHLQVHGRVHSREEWQKFCDERFRAKFARAKCC